MSDEFNLQENLRIEIDPSELARVIHCECLHKMAISTDPRRPVRPGWQPYEPLLVDGFVDDDLKRFTLVSHQYCMGVAIALVSFETDDTTALTLLVQSPENGDYRPDGRAILLHPGEPVTMQLVLDIAADLFEARS